jgi:hypothetical protein
MQRRKHNTFDKTGIGFLAGFLVPVIIFFAVYLFGENEISVSDYVKNLWYLHALVKLGSLCIFGNLAVFFGFLRLKYEKAAKGVLGATLVYAFAVLVSRAF